VAKARAYLMVSVMCWLLFSRQPAQQA